VTVDAIVVAAGASSRMGGADKLLVPLGGRPLLAHALAAIAAAPSVERIVLVGPSERADALRAGGMLPNQVALVPGGRRRQESVAAGVAALADRPGDAIVLVHDGARPNVKPELVEAVARAAATHGAAIPVVPIAETVKRIADGRVAETLDRAELAAAQTPQGVRLEVLRAAYERFDPAGPQTFTDEAALLEACKIAVHAIPGDPENLKVTVPADLARLERSMSSSGRPRVGFGRDEHPFGPGEPLVLGAVRIEGAPRLHGHSDGDVALHALADALLGAAGLPDLGRLFPAGPVTPRGVASSELLAEVVRRLDESGFRPSAVDLTIVAARPRLAEHLDAMQAAIAGLLGIGLSAVSVKGSTANLAGMEGAGRGISAQAVATIEPST
jgi:2-C-methyl-D-erythritol 4-phosphate cytidylyltransferase/2-C-methyl-D-erythritol 2,4-cyclodiphosphate synthase